jgi:two-component system, chemotaxis family, chemotaxis protein CheY
MKQTILVVDDSPTVRKFVATSLQMKGFNVVTAADGMEALERMPNEEISIVITDLNMPDMDGIEFIRALREAPAYRHIPVIVLSSMSDENLKSVASNLGVFSYLEKPFDCQRIQYEVARLTN